MDWRHRAACRDVDPELFFPIGNTGPALMQIEEAKQVCRSCSAVDSCLKWALESVRTPGSGAVSARTSAALSSAATLVPAPAPPPDPTIPTRPCFTDHA